MGQERVLGISGGDPKFKKCGAGDRLCIRAFSNTKEFNNSTRTPYSEEIQSIPQKYA